MEDGIEETLTYMDFPSKHWLKIRTNNVIACMNREIRRRTRFVGTFHDGKSALMFSQGRKQSNQYWLVDSIPTINSDGSIMTDSRTVLNFKNPLESFLKSNAVLIVFLGSSIMIASWFRLVMSTPTMNTVLNSFLIVFRTVSSHLYGSQPAVKLEESTYGW